MDDEQEYNELLKAEADEKCDTRLVIRMLKIIATLLAIAVSVSLVNQIFYFITTHI